MRVLLSVTVQVRAQLTNGKSIDEETRTLVVNAHGALVTLSTPVPQGQQLSITHMGTKQSLECQVVFVGAAQGGKTQLGLEFVKPSPGFWQVSFPPEDWS